MKYSPEQSLCLQKLRYNYSLDLSRFSGPHLPLVLASSSTCISLFSSLLFSFPLSLYFSLSPIVSSLFYGVLTITLFCPLLASFILCPIITLSLRISVLLNYSVVCPPRSLPFHFFPFHVISLFFCPPISSVGLFALFLFYLLLTLSLPYSFLSNFYLLCPLFLLPLVSPLLIPT